MMRSKLLTLSKSFLFFLFLIIGNAHFAQAQTNVVPDDVEFQALKALYDSLGGSTWTTKTNWPTQGNWPATATAAQMGTWYGVTVTNGDISTINLGSNNLTGKLPSHIGQLTRLVQVILNSNKLSGTVTSSLNSLTRLTLLRLHTNLLTGQIPDLSGLSNLLELSINANAFTPGPIPSWISTLQQLQILNVGGTGRMGSIPVSLCNLSHLVTLYLYSNSLTGSIPTEIGSLSNLTTLYLYQNQLSGSIPSSIGSLTKLVNLYLYTNQLTGEIPSTIGNLVNLVTLNLFTNQLTGSIPSSIGNLTKLTSFAAYSNQLTGSIPSTIGNLTNLTYLQLSSNQLSGSIPSEIGNLTKLTSLLLHVNKLTGPLPSSIGNLVNLTQIYLYTNQLTGDLPSTIGNFTKLTFFAAYGNQFTGSLPSAFGNLSELTFLDISNNKFSGLLSPTLFSNLTKLATVNLATNNFTGAFPNVATTPALTSLTLTGNQFTSLPSSSLNLPVLLTLSADNNKLNNIPDFSFQVNKINLTLKLHNNVLDFSQLEPLVGAGIKTLTFSPQKTISDVSTQSLTVATDLVLTAHPKGSFTSNIKWEKLQPNGVTWSDVSSSNADALTGNTYRIVNASSSTEGKYRWSCTSSKATGFTLTSDPIAVKTPERFTIDNLAFQYKYDERKRMIAKRVPGAEWMYMVYDNRDRLVLMQDGEQRKTNKWSFTKYDVLNRPIITGIYTHGSYLDQAGMGALISTAVFSENYSADPFNHGYSNTVFPILSINNSEVMSVTYYDNYNFNSDQTFFYRSTELSDQYTYANGSAFPRVNSQVTGTKIKVMDAIPYWIKTVNYYDDKYRVVQTISDNHRNGIEVVTNTYDFVGKVLKSKETLINRNPLWQNVVGTTVTSNGLIKTASNGWGNAGASSIEILPANTDGWLEVTMSETTLNRMVGLSDQDTDQNTTSMDFAIYQQQPNYYVYENGVYKKNIYEPSNPNANSNKVRVGDVMRIQRVGSSIKYYWNDFLVYTSTTPSTSALMIDAALNNVNSTLLNVRSSFSDKVISSITRTFDYDHAGRLLKTLHSVNGAAPVLLAQNEYNELGQLVDKKLYSTDNGSTFKQSVDYRYNIRGWLTSINNGQLTVNNSNDDSNDLFGMNLHYNDLVTGLTATSDAQYNGNISAIQYSNNQALGTVKSHGYKFGYDPMNRLLSATHKERTGGWNASGSYHEDNLSYDLNGNIKSLSRRGENANLMDVLSYDYGTGNTASNKLLSVSDTGDKAKGFIDGNVVGDDYTYDANGNMLIDKNKSIITSAGAAGITYNHLNLPEKVVKSNGDYIKYVYDATGRKLSQGVYNSTNVLKKKTDYVGEYFYENDTLKFINHEEGRVFPSTNLIKSPDGESTTGFAPVRNVTLSSVQNNGQTYLKGLCWQEESSAGIWVNDWLQVTPGQKFTFKVKGYTDVGTLAYLYIYGNNNADLVWLTDPLPVGVQNEGYVTREFQVPNGVSSIRPAVLWTLYHAGDAMYLNEVIFSPSGTPPTTEYQYNLKDHLGNVRITFTTKDDIQVSTATLETANVTTEHGQFLNYDEAIKINSLWFDHSHRTAGGASNTTQYATRLMGGNTNSTIGLAKSLSVMPGDKIDIEVFAKYLDPNPNNLNQALKDFITSIATGGSAPGGTIIDGGFAGSLGNNTFPFAGFFTHGSESNTSPKAYLNYLVFDRNYVFKTGGFKRVSSAAIETGTDGLHERLYFDGVDQIKITEPGYIYIWLSNENETPTEVYFDDFKVTHTKSPVISTDDYYPFGLTFNSYSRENSVENKYLYNQGTGEKTFKTERVFDLGLNVDQSRDRTYDYITGRWWQVDPKAEVGGQESWSTYSYSFNNPIRFNDPYGDCIPCITNTLLAKYSAFMAGMSSSSSQGAGTRLMTNSSSTIQQTAGTDRPVSRLDTKAVAKLGDAKIVADVTAKNTKTLANEVSKDGLAAARAVGTGIEVAGMGTPISGVGATINATAGALDEARQVAFEGKSGSDAMIDTGVGFAIDKTFSKLGNAAKTTVGGAEKTAHDKTVSAYEFSFTNLFQWVADKITDNNREKK
jgi:RHS repeat-associated protein